MITDKIQTHPFTGYSYYVKQTFICKYNGNVLCATVKSVTLQRFTNKYIYFIYNVTRYNNIL